MSDDLFAYLVIGPAVVAGMYAVYWMHSRLTRGARQSGDPGGRPGRHRIVVADNLSTNIAGTQGGLLVMPGERAEGDLAAFLATMPQSEAGRLKYLAEMTSLALRSRLAGGQQAKSQCERVLRKFWTEELSGHVAKKLLATLRDGQRHNFATIITTREGICALISANTRAGRFLSVSPSLKGEFWPEFSNIIGSLSKKAGAKPACALSVDFFVEDVQSPTEGGMYLAAAVTFLPLDPKRLAPELCAGVVHVEMLADEERRELGL